MAGVGIPFKNRTRPPSSGFLPRPKPSGTEEVDVPKRDSKYTGEGAAQMLTVKVKRPHIDPSLCVGCGACEKACPVVDKPAVYVTSAGETRSRTNVILLQDKGDG